MRYVGQRTLILCACIVLYSCTNQAPLPYATYATSEQPYEPKAESQNAFDAYCLAAISAQQDASVFIDRVYFTESLKKQAIEAAGPALAKLRQGTSMQAEFVHTATDLFEPHPYRPAWALLGKCLVWQIEAKTKEGLYDDALEIARTALLFSADLMGGDARDVSLGFETSRTTRQSIASNMVSMSASQLSRWEAILRESLERLPDPGIPLRNEEKIMLLGVQYVQDLHQTGQLQVLLDTLGVGVDRTVRHLSGNIKETDRVAFFENFAQEARDQVEFEIDRIRRPHVDAPDPFDPKGTRHWHRLTPHFFFGPNQIVSQYREHLVRTRLLLVDAGLKAAKKSGEPLPDSLDRWGQNAIDPMTGRPFEYHVANQEFKLYGLGENGRDDGGETDRTGWMPDTIPESEI